MQSYNPNIAIQEEQPFQLAAATNVRISEDSSDRRNSVDSRNKHPRNSMASSYSEHLNSSTDWFHNPIQEPDRNNPTRSRSERPLDTIRSFEYAVYKGQFPESNPNNPDLPSNSAYYGAQYNKASDFREHGMRTPPRDFISQHSFHTHPKQQYPQQQYPQQYPQQQYPQQRQKYQQQQYPQPQQQPQPQPQQQQVSDYVPASPPMTPKVPVYKFTSSTEGDGIDYTKNLQTKEKKRWRPFGKKSTN